MAQAAAVPEILEKGDLSILEAVQFRRGVYVERKRREALEGWLQAAGKPRDAEKAVAAALALWTTGRPKEALEALPGAAKSPVATYVRARCLIETGEASQAVEVLKKAGGHEAETPELQILYAEALVESGDLDQAQSALKKLQAKNDQRGEFHYAYGRYYEKSKQPEAMLEAYERAVQFEPENARALFRLGLFYDLYGEDEKALPLYEKCSDLNPTHVNALVNLGILYEDRGDYAKAIDCYRRILKAHPTHDRAILFLKDAIASTSMFYDEELRKEQERRRQLLATPIVEFEMSVRARKCLEKMQVSVLGDLVQKSEKELLSYRNFGETSLREIRDLLQAKGLSLGQKVEPRPVTWYEIVHTPERDEKKEMLDKPVSVLGLSVRSARCLARLRVRTVGELVDKSVNDLLDVRNFGKTSLSEIQKKLALFGFSLKADGEIAV